MARVLAREDYRLQVGPPSIFSLFNWRLVLALLANIAAWYVAVMAVIFAIDATAKGWWF